MRKHEEQILEETLPIQRLESDLPYTAAEWTVILQHSIGKRGELQLRSEHLSQTRLQQSVLEGFAECGMEQYRGEIWKLLCRTSDYPRGL
jgi:hypothetical protein